MGHNGYKRIKEIHVIVKILLLLLLCIIIIIMQKYSLYIPRSTKYYMLSSKRKAMRQF